MDTTQENRKKALDINNSIWVSASAGSGKTTVLVDRLLSLLINDVDISKIVCITYTKTGANEMKSRIYNSLSNWATISDDLLKLEIEKRLNIKNVTTDFLNKARTLFAKVIDNIDNLKIFTIHSFCQQIISRFPIEAGIYPNFEVIDDYNSNTLIKTAINNAMLLAKNNPEINNSIKSLILEKNEEKFNELINYIIGKRKEFEYIAKEVNYKSELRQIFNIKYNTEQEIIDNFLNYDYSKIIELSNYIQENDFTDKQKKDFQNMANLLPLTEKNIDEYKYTFVTKDNTIRKDNTRTKIINNDFTKDIYINEANRCIEFTEDLENTKYYNLTISVINFGIEIIKHYKLLKNERGLLDFDDLIMTTLNLLQNTEYSAWINYKLDSGIEHILLDEAQDTSSLQWKIMEYLTGDFFVGETKENNRTIFVVGDEKQSIFSFQGANPEMFNIKYNFYKKLIENSRNIFHKIDLQKSYRSLETILKFVDTVFIDKNYINKISKLDSEIKHYNYRSGIGLVEVWPLISVDKIQKDEWELDFENDIETQKQELLAKNIVNKIIYLVNSNRAIVTKSNKKRKIKYGDIMILQRSRNPFFLSYLIKYLNENNIPNSGVDRIDLFNNIVIKDFLSLFNFIIFNNDDLSLANLVKSPFLNLTENDLYELCRYKVDNDITLFESFANNEKYKKQYDFLNDIINKSKELNIYDLCFYVLENCNIKKNILARYGESITLILNNFLDFIINYEEQNNSSLISFIDFINNNKNEIKKEFEENLNQVKIMTVHSSKGMQAPIVFLADANNAIDENRENLFWIFRENNNDLPIYKTGAKTDIIKNIKNINALDSHSEYFRLFYVGMTRAENELYICGVSKSKKQDENEIKEEKKQTWYDLSVKAMRHLNYEEKKFDFDDKLKKLTYGIENIIDNNVDNRQQVQEYKDRDKINKIIENIKIYTNTQEEIKIITPSQFYNHIDRDDRYDKVNLAILKGNAIHKLLEVLPDSKKEDGEKIADIYLNNYFTGFDNNDKQNIKHTVFNILNNEEFKFFFTENSKSEVAIVGNIDGFSVLGQIDRLVELEDKILILDYKNTSKNYKKIEDLPDAYIKQLQLYKKLVEKIYSNKAVECYILITGYGSLIKVF